MKQVIAAARKEVIQTDNFMTFKKQPLTQVRTNKSCSPRDQNSHLRLLE
jgi:hypothetical protein